MVLRRAISALCIAAMVASVFVPSLAAAGGRLQGACAKAGLSGVGEQPLATMADPSDAGDGMKRPMNFLPILRSVHAWNLAVLSQSCNISEAMQDKPNHESASLLALSCLLAV